MTTTAQGNDEGPTSKEMWDKLDYVEQQNDLILNTIAVALKDLSAHAKGYIALGLLQQHSRLRSSMGQLYAMRRKHADPDDPEQRA